MPVENNKIWWVTPLKITVTLIFFLYRYLENVYKLETLKSSEKWCLKLIKYNQHQV